MKSNSFLPYHIYGKAEVSFNISDRRTDVLATRQQY